MQIEGKYATIRKIKEIVRAAKSKQLIFCHLPNLPPTQLLLAEPMYKGGYLYGIMQNSGDGLPKTKKLQCAKPGCKKKAAEKILISVFKKFAPMLRSA